jgi:hypothetical protein
MAVGQEYVPNVHHHRVVCTLEAAFERLEVREQAREEPEEWLLLEHLTKLLVLVRENQGDDGEDLLEDMRFSCIVGLFTVVLDHEDKETRKGIDVQVRVDGRAALDNVDVAIDANFDADPEKHRARIVVLEKSSALQFNCIDEEITVSSRSLVELDPVDEELFQLWVEIVKVLGQRALEVAMV